MKVAILYNKPESELLIENDVLLQVEAVKKALSELAYEVCEYACDLNLGNLHSFLKSQKPDLAFNLVESLAGSDRLIGIVPSLLDVLCLPYTGCSAKSIVLTSDKIESKLKMVAAGIPTPGIFLGRFLDFLSGESYIIKPIYEHASFALDDNSVVLCNNADELTVLIANKQQEFNKPFFAERYIEGREFNVSVISSPLGGAMILPLSEIEFSDFPQGKPKIFGYEAKWNEQSFEYENINRKFKTFEGEESLCQQLEQLSLKCWDSFKLQGYVRIDYRVDSDNKPYVLEINANPCLTPLCAFPSALEQAGIGFTQGIDWIVKEALERCS